MANFNNNLYLAAFKLIVNGRCGDYRKGVDE